MNGKYLTEVTEPEFKGMVRVECLAPRVSGSSYFAVDTGFYIDLINVNSCLVVIDGEVDGHKVYYRFGIPSTVFGG